MHLLRSQTAVNAERVYAQTLEHGNRGIHRAAGQQLAFFVENQRYEHRQIAVFLGSQHGRLSLVAVAHGLNEHEVRTGFRADTDGFAEQLDRTLERQIAHRLQQLAGWANIERNIGILSACLLTRGFCMRNCSLYDFLQVIRIFKGICTESVGVHYITASFKVAAVQRNNLIRMGQVPRFRQFTGF